MNTEIGKKIKQLKGFYALIPNPFPAKELFKIPQNILLKTAEADRLIGKLDGTTTENALPDINFFLRMFVAKDATSSAQIEGTKATIVDAIEKDAGVAAKETDADDILYYIKALKYGTKRLNEFPLSLRLIKEIHAQLMTGARTTHFSDPGEFRKTQNWIGGTRPDNAHFVPPSVGEMNRALNDFEKFLREEKKTLPLIHMGLMHAQFETIHPFLDGNGRTGRLLVTLLLCQESIEITSKIRQLRDSDMLKIQALAKRESESGVLVLSHLFGYPIVNTRKVMEWTKFTRAGAQRVIDRFVNLGILKPQEERGTYDRSYIYQIYVNIFLR